MSKITFLSRRHLLQLSAAFAGAPAYAQSAYTQDQYPQQTINLIVPDSGGGSFDAYARKFSQIMMPLLHPSVNVEPLPVPGAGGQAAAFQLLNDPPDGYTIGILNVPGIITGAFGKHHKKLDLGRLSWIANLGRERYGVAVSTKSGLQSIDDLKKLSATRKIKFSSTGFGSTDFFATRVFATVAGLNFTQVLGYTGSAPTMIAVAQGEVDAVVHSLATLQAMQTSGLIRIIFAFQPDPALPDVQTARAAGMPDLENIFQWRPVAGPPNLPRPIIETLSGVLTEAAKQPAAAAWAKTAGTTLYPMGYAEMPGMLRSQYELVQKYRAVLVKT